MAKINIYFQNLNEETQQELWQLVKEELETKENQKVETGEEREEITDEVIDDYINCHNFVNYFEI